MGLTTTTLSFRRAVMADAAEIAALVNICYRGETSRQGWTTEADLLKGLRTDVAEVSSVIADEAFIILLCQRDLEIVGSVCIERQGDQAHLGLFVVKPSLQGKNIGKQLLQFAEQAAQQNWQVSKMVMTVISCRHELIAFYERRGYQRTQVFKEFPVNPELWQPQVEGLQLEILEKPLTGL